MYKTTINITGQGIADIKNALGIMLKEFDEKMGDYPEGRDVIDFGAFGQIKIDWKINSLIKLRIWPDDTWQDADEESPISWMSDDYIEVYVTAEEYEAKNFSYDRLVKRI